MASEKIKISKAEFAEMYEWTDEKEDAHKEQDQEEITVTESFAEMTERKDKEEYGS